MASSQTTNTVGRSNNNNTTKTSYGDIGFTGDTALGLVTILTAATERQSAQNAFTFQNLVNASQSNLRLVADKVAPTSLSQMVPFIVVVAGVVGTIAVVAKLRR